MIATKSWAGWPAAVLAVGALAGCSFGPSGDNLPEEIDQACVEDATYASSQAFSHKLWDSLDVGEAFNLAMDSGGGATVLCALERNDQRSFKEHIRVVARMQALDPSRKTDVTVTTSRFGPLTAEITDRFAFDRSLEVPHEPGVTPPEKRLQIVDMAGRTDAGSVAVRARPSAEAEAIARLERDTPVTILGNLRADDGRTWSYLSRPDGPAIGYAAWRSVKLTESRDRPVGALDAEAAAVGASAAGQVGDKPTAELRLADQCAKAKWTSSIVELAKEHDVIDEDDLDDLTLFVCPRRAPEDEEDAEQETATS